MLQIQNLTITHKKDLRVLIRDLTLSVEKGDRIALIGEEGNGKSTLLKWIFDPASVEEYASWEGRRVAGRLRMAYLPQELPGAEKTVPVREYLARRAEEAGKAVHDVFRALLELGLPSSAASSEQPMGTLSGGERIRVQMAALLFSDPDLYLLDEPSNDLDLDTLAWLERFIASPGRTVLFISHDETLLARTANRILLIEQLRKKQAPRHVVANVPFEQFRDERLAAFAKQEQLAGSERREERKAMERFRRIEQRVETEQRNISRGDPHGGRLLKKKMASVKAMERRYAREHDEMTEFPEAEEAITIRFENMLPLPRSKTVLDLELPELFRGAASRPAVGEQFREDAILSENIRLVVRGGEKVGIVGTNGVGKTTLLRIIRDRLADRDDLRVFYLPQNYGEALAPDVTPVGFLVPSGGREEETLVRTYLGSMKFTADEMFHPVRDLSGGQKAKLLFLKMSISRANVLLLDEPTRNISPLSGPRIRALLQAYEGCVISVSHDRKYLEEVCTAVYEMSRSGLRKLRG